MALRVLSSHYKVDGKPMLEPDLGVEISEADLDASDTGRDESGVMHRVVVREGVRTWNFAYGLLDLEDYSYIKSLFQGKPLFTFTFPNEDGTTATATAYCSKRSITLYNHTNGCYKNLKFSVIEC